jgi:hypothetical protein
VLPDAARRPRASKFQLKDISTNLRANAFQVPGLDSYTGASGKILAV